MTAITVTLDVLLVLVALTGAVTDVWKRKIYDWLTYPAMALGLILHTVGFGFGGVFELGLVSSIAGAFFCLAVFGAFFVWGKGFGAGDVKLMVGLGALAGLINALTVAMCSALIGALMAVGVLFFTRKGLHRARGWFVSKKKSVERAAAVTVPYGLAIGLGTIWALLIKYRVL